MVFVVRFFTRMWRASRKKIMRAPLLRDAHHILTESTQLFISML